MKTFSNLFVALILILAVAACTGKGSGKKTTGNDTITVPDTGYTGIKQYMSGNHLIKEVTFKNGSGRINEKHSMREARFTDSGMRTA